MTTNPNRGDSTMIYTWPFILSLHMSFLKTPRSYPLTSGLDFTSAIQDQSLIPHVFLEHLIFACGLIPVLEILGLPPVEQLFCTSFFWDLTWSGSESWSLTFGEEWTSSDWIDSSWIRLKCRHRNAAFKCNFKSKFKSIFGQIQVEKQLVQTKRTGELITILL